VGLHQGVSDSKSRLGAISLTPEKHSLAQTLDCFFEVGAGAHLLDTQLLVDQITELQLLLRSRLGLLLTPAHVVRAHRDPVTASAPEFKEIKEPQTVSAIR
jgi:hypothetical protein